MTEEEVLELVKNWFEEVIKNSVVSQDTRSYNGVYDAVEDLKNRIHIAATAGE